MIDDDSYIQRLIEEIKISNDYSFEKILAIDYDQTNGNLYAGDDNGNVYVIKSSEKRTESFIKISNSSISCLKQIDYKDQKCLMIASEDNIVSILNLENRDLIQKINVTCNDE